VATLEGGGYARAKSSWRIDEPPTQFTQVTDFPLRDGKIAFCLIRRHGKLNGLPQSAHKT
jgi:hypothetical protein